MKRSTDTMSGSAWVWHSVRGWLSAGRAPGAGCAHRRSGTFSDVAPDAATGSMQTLIGTLEQLSLADLGVMCVSPSLTSLLTWIGLREHDRAIRHETIPPALLSSHLPFYFSVVLVSLHHRFHSLIL